MEIKPTRGSGNVFQDVGFSETEAEHLTLRGELMLRVQQALRARGLKQAEAAGCWEFGSQGSAI
jgi:predicted XRE-type DNA-binding protein